MKIDQAPNPDLKWETTSSLNVGLELSMLNNRLSVDVDYYRDASRDLIASKDVSAVTGFLNKYVNYANVKNQGVDIAVSGYIIREKQGDEIEYNTSSTEFGEKCLYPGRSIFGQTG